MSFGHLDVSSFLRQFAANTTGQWKKKIHVLIQPTKEKEKRAKKKKKEEKKCPCVIKTLCPENIKRLSN